MNSIRLTRDELYEAIWSELTQSLAKPYGMSDVALAKTCRRPRIPKPGRGYWQKKQSGLRVRRTPLPKLRPDDREQLASVTFGPRQRAIEAAPEEPTGPVADQERYEAEHPITVPMHMGRSHPLVKLTRDEQSQHYHKRRGLDVKVSRESWVRALKIMNTLVKSLERRGFAVTTSPSEDAPTTLVEVHGTQLGIRLEERYRKIEREPTEWERQMAEDHEWWKNRKHYENVPSGRLTLLIDGSLVRDVRQSWSDGKRQRLENCLNNFMVGLVAAAEAKKRYELEWEEEQRRWAEEARRYEEERHRRKLERQREKRLEQLAEKWAKAERIRRFVASAQRVDVDLSWLSWAQDYAERIDPLSGTAGRSQARSGATGALPGALVMRSRHLVTLA